MQVISFFRNMWQTISRNTGKWSPRLHDLGECEVKHGVRLHVCNLHTAELGNPEVPEKFKQPNEQKQPASAPVTVADGTRQRSRWGVIAVLLLVIAALAAGRALFFAALRAANERSGNARPIGSSDLGGPREKHRSSAL